MDNENIKILRSKIAMPLDIAIKLLKENNSDVDASIIAFHSYNITEISVATDCDIETAKAVYYSLDFDVTKAIKKINSLPVFITTRENPRPANEIGFVLYPVSKNGEFYKTEKRNDVFIPAADFDHIIDAFKSVFPLKNPWNEQIADQFDICSDNFFDVKTCRGIVDIISNSQTDNPTVLKFKNEVVHWMNERLKYADFINVFGNL